MLTVNKSNKSISRIAGPTLGLGLLSAALFSPLTSQTATQRYIVQGAELAAVKAAVQAVGVSWLMMSRPTSASTEARPCRSR